MAFSFIAHGITSNLAVILPIYVKANRPGISPAQVGLLMGINYAFEAVLSFPVGIYL
jgi:hypothetical protein